MLEGDHVPHFQGTLQTFNAIFVKMKRQALNFH